MKRQLCVVFFLGTAIYVFSQNKIKYTYDSAGNRTKKEIVSSSTRSLFSSESKQVLHIEEKQNHEIKIYPNPTKGIVNIQFATENIGNGEISVYNISEELITKINFSDSYQTIDLSTQPDGFYIIRIMLEDKVYHWKIVKE